MSKKSKRRTRAEPARGPVQSWLCAQDTYDMLCSRGYRRLSDCPEVLMAVDYIASLISSMTIYLMANTAAGDVRVRNGLSAAVDIAPNPPQTRRAWMYTIVRSMLLEGDGNAVVMPVLSPGDAYIDRLIPLPPADVSFIDESARGYTIQYAGARFDPSELLHFTWQINPDRPYVGHGARLALRDVVDNLAQAAATKRGFMESKWKPSLIVRVDALTDEFSGPEGRRKLLEQYMSTSSAGEPWVIPNEFMDVQQVTPLSLTDLAINEAVEIDKRAVAALFGVPAFVVGAGAYSKEEYNAFIASVILPIARGIEQELTSKLLVSPHMFFQFNPRSLYAYDITEISEVGAALVDRMAMTRNEWRAWIGMQPREDMEELLALENYIPASQLGAQKKLVGASAGGGDDDGDAAAGDGNDVPRSAGRGKPR